MELIKIIRKNRSFFLGIFMLLAFRWSFADQYRVPSGSMEPNIQIGDHLAVNKMAYDFKVPFTDRILLRLSEPQRGDVVVFKWPVDPSMIFVKRLIGLPGDRVHIENGFITVNGQTLEHITLNPAKDHDSYREHLGRHAFEVQRLPPLARDEARDFVVPEESYFFMGDNRDNSLDSRAWGFVKREALKGKAIGVLWNIRFDRIFPRLDIRRVLAGLG